MTEGHLRSYKGVRKCPFQQCWTINGFEWEGRFFSARRRASICLQAGWLTLAYCLLRKMLDLAFKLN